MQADAASLSELNEPTIDFLILADRAEALNGKLYVMGGGWDRYTVQDFRQPVSISFALGILVPWNATSRERTIQVTIEDLDRNQPVEFSVQVNFVVGRPATAREGQTQRIILAIPAVPVRFPGAGVYQAVARILDGDERRIEFHMVSAEAGLPR